MIVGKTQRLNWGIFWLYSEGLNGGWDFYFIFCNTCTIELVVSLKLSGRIPFSKLHRVRVSLLMVKMYFTVVRGMSFVDL